MSTGATKPVIPNPIIHFQELWQGEDILLLHRVNSNYSLMPELVIHTYNIIFMICIRLIIRMELLKFCFPQQARHTKTYLVLVRVLGSFIKSRKDGIYCLNIS